MIIHRPEITSTGETVTVSARVEFEIPIPDMPESLWFEFPKEYEDLVTDRADAFLSTMLLVAMRNGEKRIKVRGEVSPAFSYRDQRISNGFRHMAYLGDSNRSA
ncbi:MAG: hypothetical protein R3B51_02785 [Thermodesulfobacteriota bacterium]